MLESHQHEHNIRDFDGILDDRVQKIPRYFTLLFYGLVAWGLGFCGYYLLSGWSSQAEFEAELAAHRAAHEVPTAGAPAAVEISQVEMGRIFAERCAACHGAEGKGGIGPDLTREQFVYGRTEDQIAESIAAGRKGMPAFGNELPPDQIRQVARYVLTLK